MNPPLVPARPVVPFGVARRGPRVLVLALAAVCIASPRGAAAPTRAPDPPGFSFAPGSAYASNVPPPAAILGHEVGARFVDHAAVGRVLDAICGASDRARLVQYGESAQGRPLYAAFVSSPENLARLPEIAAGLARLRDPRAAADGSAPALGDEERERLLATLPVVCWLSFSVHGNEPSGTEAALPLLYHLVACEDEVTRGWLNRAVVVIDPALNPDGRDRYVHWYRDAAGRVPDPDPQGREHREPWPPGRQNGYHFDLNRDWAFATQVETRARLALYRRTPPQVHADLHEMSYELSYFFFPAAPPFHRGVPPESRALAEVFGRANGAAFDAFGWPYYTAERFDLLFPGYGDSWPTLNGAIGMTYEQAGHSAAGLAVRRDDGSVLTLADRAAHHFTAALATVRTSVEHREALLRNFARFHADAIWEGENGGLRGVALVPGADRGRVRDLVEILLLQGVEVRRAPRAFEAPDARAFPDADPEVRTLPEGTYLVDLAQPAGRLARALLEPRTTIRTQDFYDLSAWSLPLAFGVEAYALGGPTGLDAPAIDAPPAPPPASVGPARAGWLVPWDSMAAPRFLAAVSRDGVLVRAATRPFRHEGRRYERGTLLVPALQPSATSAVARGAAVAGDGVALRETLRAAADRAGVEVIAADGGWTDEGPELGSGTFVALRRPDVAVMTGDGVDSTSYGACLHLLEVGLGLPFTALPLEDLSGADLRPYNVIVFPDGRGYPRALDGDARVSLRAFLQAGGVLIASGDAAFAVASAELIDAAPRRAKDDAKPDEAPWRLADQRLASQERNVPGTFFRAALDPDRELAFGVGDEVAVLLESIRVFEPSRSTDSIARLTEAPLLSGHASEASVSAVAGGDYLVSGRLGRGRIVLFAADPLFRGFLRGQVGLFTNAIFLVGRP